MPHELIEAHEFKEQLAQALERAEKAGEEKVFPRWTQELSLSTAIIAVFTAISSLGAGYLSNHALIAKNEAVHLQAKASDEWAYYQAKAIKGLIFETRAEIVAPRNAALAKSYRAQTQHYMGEQIEIKKSGDALEKKIQEANAESERCLHYHHAFAMAVTLFQVTIALSAIAVLTWRKSLWWTGLAISAAALVFAIKGLLFFV